MIYYFNIIRQIIQYERPILLGRWKINSNEKVILDRKIDLANYDNCGITRFKKLINLMKIVNENKL